MEQLLLLNTSFLILFLMYQLLLCQKMFDFSSGSSRTPWYMTFCFPTWNSGKDHECWNYGPLFAGGTLSNPEATQSTETIGLVVGEGEGLKNGLWEIHHCHVLCYKQKCPESWGQSLKRKKQTNPTKKKKNKKKHCPRNQSVLSGKWRFSLFKTIAWDLSLWPMRWSSSGIQNQFK